MVSMAISTVMAAETFELDDIKYEVTKAATSTASGECVVVGLSSAGSSKTSVALNLLPRITYNSKYYYVEKVANNAFKNSSIITGVRFGYGFTEIGLYAFYGCSNITYVRLPSSMKSIGGYAFWGCSKLTSIYTAKPTAVNAMTNAFPTSKTNPSLTVYTPKTDPNSITNYNPRSWNAAWLDITNYQKSSLAYDFAGTDGSYMCVTKAPAATEKGELTIVGFNPSGKNVTDGAYTPFDTYTIYGYSYKVVAIADSAYLGISTMKSINLEGSSNLRRIGVSAFQDVTSLTGTVKTSADTINMRAFSGCTGITSMLLMEGVKQLKTSPFRGCTSLPSLVIPASVTSITASDFVDGCTSMAYINVNASNSYYASYNGILYNKDKTTLLRCPQGYTKDQLGTSNFPSTIKEIRDYAFYKCSNLVNVWIPFGVKSVGYGTFWACDKMEYCRIPSSVTTMGANVFAECSSLYMLDNNMTSVRDFSAETRDQFAGTKRSSGTLFVPYELIDSYKAATYWKDWKSIISGSSDIDATCVTKTDGTSSSANFSVTSTKPETINGVSYDGRCALVHCSTITTASTINIPEYVSFYGKKYAVTRVGSEIFRSQCTADFTVKLGVNVDTVATKAFKDQIKLTTLNLNPNLKAIEPDAFNNCRISNDIILPYGLTYLGYNVFSYNTFKRLLVPSTAMTLNSYAFENLGKLEEFILNNSYGHKYTNWVLTDIPTSCKLYVPTGVVLQYKQNEKLGKLKVNAGAYDFCYQNNHDGTRYFMTVTSNTPVTVDGITYAGKAKYVYHPMIESRIASAATKAYQASMGETDRANGANRTYLMVEMGDSLLYGASSCTSALVPKYLERVGKYAFCKSSITDMIIPSTCSYIGKEAWVNCSKLKELTLLTPSGSRSWSGQFFGGNAGDFICYVNWSSLTSYMNSAASWTKLTGDTREMKDCFNGFFQENNDYGCTSFSVNHPVDWRDMPIKVYTVSSYDASAKLAKTTQQNYTPANTGLILTGYENGTIYKLKRPSFTPGRSTNLLVGDADANVNVYNETVGYLFSRTDKVFWKPTSDYTLAMGYAYLKLTSAQAGSTTTINVDLFNTGLKGDVDGNGVVDITDANILINIVLGKDQASNYGGRADVTGEGDIDVSDINAVLNIILGK